MALTLLLADPNEEWLASAKSFFEKAFYRVTTVSNGRDAQLELYNHKFFASVINIDIKNHSGIQVLKFIRANYPNQTTVVICPPIPEDSMEDDELNPEKLKKLGATEVLISPIEFEDIRKALEGHQSIGDMISSVPKRKELGDEVEVDAEDEKFTKVKIDEFYSSKALLFDIYIKLKSNRYIKILHAGDSLSKERIDKYKNEKEVEFLYFEKKDLFKYVKYNNHFAQKVIKNDKVSAGKKLKTLQNVSEKFLEQSFQEGMKPQIIDQGKEIAENIHRLVEGQKDLHKTLRSYQDFDPNAFTHAYLTTIFSTAIIKQFDWESKTTIECTAFACLFHDIGMMKLPDLKDKSVDDMTETEYEQYQRHPELGLEIIDGNPLINNSIKQIILQHHEHYDGTGFPFAKRGSKILMLSNIVALANHFSEIIQEKELNPLQALKHFLAEREKLVWYNSQVVENLIKVFADPEKIIKENKLPSNSHVVNKKAS